MNAILVEHGGDIAAVRAVLGTLLIADCVITLDALHITRDIARIIVETHKADDLSRSRAMRPKPGPR